MICRHCRRNKVNRPRGLCWSCFYTPGVRDKYPSTSKFAQRGVGNINRRGLAPIPTPALPCTEEKLVVLEGRAKLGQDLWHRLDARLSLK